MGSECLAMVSCCWLLMYNPLLAEAKPRKALTPWTPSNEKLSASSVDQGNVSPHLSLHQGVECDLLVR